MINIQYCYKTNKTKFLFVCIILLIYFFIAFLPLPLPIIVGIDGSWIYAISQAAQKQLAFGQDIVFTYGPLGYLIIGAVINQNFFQIIFFRWLIYLFLFIIFIMRVITIKNPINQLIICLSILFALFIGTPTDYQILFIFLMILSMDNLLRKYPSLLFLLLGAASGFCALTKFTLGIYTFASLNLFLLVNISQSFKRQSNTELANYLFAIINFCLAFISTSLILLAAERFLLYLDKIIINLFIAGAIGISFRLFQKRIKKQSEVRTKILLKFFNVFKNNLSFSWLVFYVIYTLLLFHTISSSQLPSLIDYLRNSLEISSGYSSAMSLVGNKIQLALAISDFFLIICLIIFIIKEGYLNLASALLFIFILSFKHGFVRQDNHVEIFATIVPLITSLLILKISRIHYQRIAYCFFAYILCASFFMLPVVKEYSEKLTATQVINNLNFLLNTKKLQLKLDKETRNELAQVQLPNNVKNLVGGKQIDIIPWEISLAPANQLNWQPRPIFQSYSAYTNTLDNINFDSLSKKNRDYLFYQFQSIDGRHPFFDEPKTFFYVFCNYEPSAEIPGFVKTLKLSNIILLEKRHESRCSPTSWSETSSIAWDTPHSVEASNNETIVGANFKFQYSIVGKIYKNLFRSPPVMMKIDYVDASEKTYRIIPENSENGVIVSHLPRDDNEALSFLKGQLPTRVKSFSFHTSNSLLYAPNIKMSFSSNILQRKPETARNEVSIKTPYMDIEAHL